jgi:ATP-binding cassette subfamily F protein 3
MWLERGEHVCLVGANGSGKSTLVRALVGERDLDAGRLRRGHNVKLAYLAQHTDLGGAEAATVLSHAQQATGLSEAKVRGLLGRFLFSGDDVQKPLRDLSGGESRRLALAVLTSSDVNLLILDEPTNHLDLESREALEDALTGFAGSVLLISHDRALLEAVGTRTLVIEDGRLSSHPGGWVEYQAARDLRRKQGSKRARSKSSTPAPAAPSKNRRAELERLEREVEAAEAELRTLEDELGDASRWSSPERSAASARRHAEAERRRDQALKRWESAAEEY